MILTSEMVELDSKKSLVVVTSATVFPIGAVESRATSKPTFSAVRVKLVGEGVVVVLSEEGFEGI